MSTTVISKGQPGWRARFKDSYLLHKLHSLSGIIPVGAFMAFHLVANSYSLRGEQEFNTTVKAIGYAPFVVLLEIVAIAVPILFHALYGFVIAAEMQGPGGNVSHYGYGRNWLYVLQRWTGVIAFVYICFHVYDTTLKKYAIEMLGKGPHEQGFASISYAAMAWRFTNPLYLAFYIVGVGAAAFHLGNGILNFCIRWGITVGKEAQKIAAGAGLAIGAGLMLLGWAIAINFAVKGQQYKGHPNLESVIQAEVTKMTATAEGK